MPMRAPWMKFKPQRMAARMGMCVRASVRTHAYASEYGFPQKIAARRSRGHGTRQPTRKGGNDECRISNVEGMNKHE
jgi:hypothetical protein